MTNIGADTLLCLRLSHSLHHVRIVAVVHVQRLRTRHLGMRRQHHRAWQCDRGGDALRGQRHDQYPKQDGSNERAHLINVAYASMTR